MHHIGYLAWIENDQYWHRKYGAAQARVVLAHFSGKATPAPSPHGFVLGLVWTAAGPAAQSLKFCTQQVKLRDAGAPDMATTILLTECNRCNRPRPRYAKGLCRSCYGLKLYYGRQGRPLPPYRVRLRRCHGCGHVMSGMVALYCEDSCRDRVALAPPYPARGSAAGSLASLV